MKFIESLERRSLFSATLHGPSAVEGDYEGAITVNGHQRNLELEISSTSLTVIVEGVGSKTFPLTKKEFIAIRKGSVFETASIHGSKYTVSGEFNSSGSIITGTISANSSKSTFSLGNILATQE